MSETKRGIARPSGLFARGPLPVLIGLAVDQLMPFTQGQFSHEFSFFALTHAIGESPVQTSERCGAGTVQEGAQRDRDDGNR